MKNIILEESNNTINNKQTNKYQNEKENVCNIRSEINIEHDPRRSWIKSSLAKKHASLSQKSESINQEVEPNQNDIYNDNFNRAKNFLKDTGFFVDSKNQVELVNNILSARKLPDNIAYKLLKLKDSRLKKGCDNFETIDLIRILGSIPYYEKSQEIEDIEQVKAYLDSTHKGLNHVKTQIIEYLATERFNKKNNIESKPRVLCLVGNPGVGKTSIARSIAEALNRKFEVLPVAGREDTLWITGSTQQYSGASYGALVDLLIKLQINNPIILVDEIDKIPNEKGRGAKIQNLFLNLFDPSTNDKFRDEFLEEYIDLSNVLWICTANYWENILEPLQSRMIKIQLDDYTVEQKLDILKDIIVPKLAKNLNNSKYKVVFSDDVYLHMIDKFSWNEGGVRQLKLNTEILFDKIITMFELKQVKGNKVTVNKALVDKLFGQSALENFNSYQKRKTFVNYKPGIVNGLGAGLVGNVIPIESSYAKGSNKIDVTGNTQNALNESVRYALNYIRSNAADLGLEEFDFTQYDYFIHLPYVSICKDGPSAGITLTTAILSAITKTIVPSDIAMTGEISLTGQVLAVGGIDKKLEACIKKGIKRVFLPKENKQDYLKLPQQIKDAVTVHFVDNYLEIYRSIFKPNNKTKIKPIVTNCN